MGGVVVGDAKDGGLGQGGPVGRGEGEAVVGSGVHRVRLHAHRLQEVAGGAAAQVQTVQAHEPIGRWLQLGHHRYPGMVSVYKEGGRGFSNPLGDFGSVESVENRLSLVEAVVQDVSFSQLGKLLQTLAGNVAQPKQRKVGTVRITDNFGEMSWRAPLGILPRKLVSVPKSSEDELVSHQRVFSAAR